MRSSMALFLFQGPQLVYIGLFSQSLTIGVTGVGSSPNTGGLPMAMREDVSISGDKTLSTPKLKGSA